MFDDILIPLNPGLVAVIGQKGMGKSALVECIAFAAGGWTGHSKGTFIERARPHLRGVDVEITWTDGQSQAIKLSDDRQGDSKVRFLSQRFVERLCAEESPAGVPRPARRLRDIMHPSD